MSSEFYRGYAAGHQAAQPEWISVKDRLPDLAGNYYTIKEALRGAPGIPIGTIVVDTAEQWHRGKWRQNDKYWKVLYWANPVRMEIPEELVRRPQIRGAA